MNNRNYGVEMPIEFYTIGRTLSGTELVTALKALQTKNTLSQGQYGVISAAIKHAEFNLAEIERTELLAALISTYKE